MTTLPAHAETVIVGGGIHGLMLAFCLAERGRADVLVVDAGYWQGGASGRNGTLVRAGFASEEWTRYFARSLELWIGLSKRLGENVMFTRRGYAIVAEGEAMETLLAGMVETHRTCGVRSRLLRRSEIADALPHAAHERIRGALYFDNAGTAPHHAVMKALKKACLARGVRLAYETPVTGFDRRNGRIAGIVCGDRHVAADLTVICCGAQNPEVAALAGVTLEGQGQRIEAMATEPMRRVIDPASRCPSVSSTCTRPGAARSWAARRSRARRRNSPSPTPCRSWRPMPATSSRCSRAWRTCASCATGPACCT